MYKLFIIIIIIYFYTNIDIYQLLVHDTNIDFCDWRATDVKLKMTGQQRTNTFPSGLVSKTGGAGVR